MANHEDVQNKLREEIINAFQERSSNITYQDLKKLPYLELVIKETLRLYPSVPFFSRSLNEDAVLGINIYSKINFISKFITTIFRWSKSLQGLYNSYNSLPYP